MPNERGVWVFHGEGGKFSSGAFSTQALGEAWIGANHLTGILTRYPLDIGIYDWAIAKGYFEPTGDEHARSQFIGRFSDASQSHTHYRNGKVDDGSEEEFSPPIPT